MRVRQNNRIKALERAGNAATAEPSHLLTQLLELEQAVDRKLTQYIAQHPLAPFVARTAGLGAGGLGRLLAVTHSLDRFKSPAALWSYLGLAVREGRAPKRATGERARWSPRGRVVCYQIGDAIVKLGRGPYRELYDRKRAEYLARPRVGPSGCPFGQTHSGVARAHDPGTGWQRKTGDARIVQCIKTDAEGNTTSAHVHAAAMRYAVKKLVLHLWVEWQRVRPGGTANPTVPTTRAICAVPAL